MIEITWSIMLTAIALGSFFVVSIIFNILLLLIAGFLIWFSYNAKKEIFNLREDLSNQVTYSNISDNIDSVLESFVQLGSKLEQVNEMPIFSDEPIVVELIEEIDSTLRDIERLLMDRDLAEFLDSRTEQIDE